MNRRAFLASLAALLGLGTVVPKAITEPTFPTGGFVPRTGRLVMGIDHGIRPAVPVVSMVNRDGHVINVKIMLTDGTDLPPTSRQHIATAWARE